MKTCFIIWLGLCACLLTHAQENVHFKLNPPIGKPIHLLFSLKTAITGEDSIRMQIRTKMDVLPTKKENENIFFDQVIKKMTFELQTGKHDISYDSENDTAAGASAMIAQQFSKIIDQKITSVVTTNGRTVSVDFPLDFARNGLNADSFSKISTSFPDSAVAVGESWKSNSTVQANDLLSAIETTSTFGEENSEGYLIDIVGKILSSGTQIGTLSGTYVLDKDTHFTKRSKIKTTITIKDAIIVSDIEIKQD